MTRNIYIGFDADVAIGALASGDPAIYGPALQTAATTLQRTDFPTRARAFAAEIALTRPHVVGLQEVYQIHADLSPLGIPSVIDLDYLAILQAALAEKGLPYVVAGKVIDSDIKPLPGIANRVRVGDGVMARTFQNNIGVIAPGVDKKAGFVMAPLRIGGMPVTVVTTHLESDLGPESYPLVSQLRAAQAAEIGGLLGDAPRAIVVGDLNDVAGSPMHQVFIGSGFVDSWPALRPREPGFTDNCFAPDLSDRLPRCEKRIDFILAKGFDRGHGELVGLTFRVGIELWERANTPAGFLWPSDHAGVVATLRAP
jgi:endonuclease/exonuclease/phosphatase family metal-dependent hydrolase